MRFLQANVKTVSFPQLYAYEAPGSAKALNAGATPHTCSSKDSTAILSKTSTIVFMIFL